MTAQPQHLPYLPNPGFRHVVLTNPETGPCMLFLFVGSQLCTPASFGRFLAVPPLPLANTCVNVLTLTGFMYRGLSPHKFTPVPGVPSSIKATGNKPLRFCAKAGCPRALLFSLYLKRI